MAQSEINSQVKNEMRCALHDINYSHICKNAIKLICNHFVCWNCFKTYTDGQKVKCKFCQILSNKSDLKEYKNYVDQLIEHSGEVFGVIIEDLNKKSEIIKKTEEKLNKHIEFINDEVRIRIESLKIEMEHFIENFMKPFESKEKERNGNESNERSIIEKLNEMNKKLNLSIENIEECREMQIAVNNFLKQCSTPLMKFRTSDYHVKANLIGEIECTQSDEFLQKNILNSLEKNELECIDIGACPLSLCLLPNDNVLMSILEKDTLYMLNSDIELVQEINSIGYKIFGIDTNIKDSIYLCAQSDNLLIKTDLMFNISSTTAETYEDEDNDFNPTDICYYKEEDQLLVADNQSIKIFNKDLNFLKVVNLFTKIRQIKITGNLFCICTESNDLQRFIRFYNVITFANNDHSNYQERNLDNSAIGTFGLCFYIFDFSKARFHVYDNNGELLKIIKREDLRHRKELEKKLEYGGLCFTNKKLFIFNDQINYLMEIKINK